MTCAHFGWDHICTQVKTRFSPFGHPTQVNTSWVTSMNLLLANEIEDSLPWNVFFSNLLVLARKLASSFGKFNLSPLATTCRFVWPGLYIKFNCYIYNTQMFKSRAANFLLTWANSKSLYNCLYAFDNVPCLQHSLLDRLLITCTFIHTTPYVSQFYLLLSSSHMCLYCSYFV